MQEYIVIYDSEGRFSDGDIIAGDITVVDGVSGIMATPKADWADKSVQVFLPLSILQKKMSDAEYQEFIKNDKNKARKQKIIYGWVPIAIEAAIPTLLYYKFSKTKTNKKTAIVYLSSFLVVVVLSSRFGLGRINTSIMKKITNQD